MRVMSIETEAPITTASGINLLRKADKFGYEMEGGSHIHFEMSFRRRSGSMVHSAVDNRYRGMGLKCNS